MAGMWRVASYVFCALFTGLAIWLLYRATSGATTIASSVGFCVLAAAILFLSWYIFRDARYRQLIITEEEITSFSPFRTVHIPLSTINGFRIVENYIILELSGNGRKRIKLSIYYERQHQLKEWLYNHFQDLDDVKVAHEFMEILSDESLGSNQGSRIDRFVAARNAAKWITGVAWGVALWVIFFPKPYLLAIFACISIPVIAIGLCYSYAGLMKGGDRTITAYPTVAVAIAVPSMAIMLRALFDFNILSFGNLWIPLLVLSIIIFVAYNIPTGGFSPRNATDYIFLFVVAIVAFAYSFGTLLCANCAVDNTQPQAFEAKVISKHISKGRTTSYYLTVEPWQGIEEPEQIKVGRKEYERIRGADRITVYQHPGWLKIPWITYALNSKEE